MNRQAFSGSVGAKYEEVCKKCGMTTTFTLIDATIAEQGFEGVDVQQALQTEPKACSRHGILHPEHDVYYDHEGVARCVECSREIV